MSKRFFSHGAQAWEATVQINADPPQSRAAKQEAAALAPGTAPQARATEDLAQAVPRMCWMNSSVSWRICQPDVN